MFTPELILRNLNNIEFQFGKSRKEEEEEENQIKA